MKAASRGCGLFFANRFHQAFAERVAAIMLALFLIITTAVAEWQSEPRLVRWKGGEVVVHHPRFGGLAYDGPLPKTRNGHELAWRVPDVGPATLVPQITSEEALRIVARQWRVTPTNRGTLVVFPVEGKAILAWRFSLSALGGRHLVWVDAMDGQIVSAKQDFWSVDGWVYDESPLDGESHIGRVAGRRTCGSPQRAVCMGQSLCGLDD